MAAESIYETLAKHLDQGIIGAPLSPALLGILNVLFPREEAEIAARLPLQNQTLSELVVQFPDKADSLEEILNRMAKRGTVFTSQRPGKERKYRLLPSVVGWAETPFWAAKDTPDARKLAPLWIKYRKEAFGEELARNKTPVMRVLPISKSLRETSEIMPYNALKPMVEAQSFCAVGHCPCRQIMTYAGKGCVHSLENCLHFGSMGRYMVEQEMAREVTTTETLEILKAANAEGLVHAAENMDGHLGTICNCCGCCCVFLDTKKNLGLHTISSSSYVAQVDSAECAGCGTCEERCPMDVIQVREEEVAVVDAAVCIGCGVCTPTCPNEAVELTLREQVTPPPDLNEFFVKRWKQEATG